MVQVRTSRYKKVDSIVLESDILEVTIIPHSGAKLQSIVNKSNGHEYLYQSDAGKYILPSYDMPFDKGDCSGFDDMFPTISECIYGDYPWEDVRIPDHGEVWALPWGFDIDKETVNLSVSGIRFPYYLRKKISFKNEDTLVIDYRLKNMSGFPLQFIWAAHPLFNCSEETQICLPDSVRKIMNVLDNSKRLGKFGSIYDWPYIDTSTDLSRIQPQSSKNCDKYYVADKLAEGWCSLLDHNTKEKITLRFSPAKTPYLGIWISEGGFMGQYNVAPEPCSGMPDRVDRARTAGRLSQVGPHGETDWFLEIDISSF